MSKLAHSNQETMDQIERNGAEPDGLGRRFIVSQQEPKHAKVYARKDIDGDWQWTPNRDHATRLTEDEADLFVAEHQKYSTYPEAVVEGVREKEKLPEAA